MDKYAVFGNPVSHSLSPLIHQTFAKQTAQSISYEAVLVPVEGFKEAVKAFQGAGLNITLPFKQEAFNLATTRSERATLAQAVNTLAWREGEWYGDNTDGVGLVRDLINNQGIILKNKRILILGAGGAARGIVGPLLDENPQEIIIANRTVEKTQQLADYFQVKSSSLEKLNPSFDLIINATSASLQNTVPSIDPTLCQNAWCYDLAYSTQETLFQTWAKQNGAKLSLNGLGMLVEQAAESFYIWRGVKPETKPVIKWLKLRKEL